MLRALYQFSSTEPGALSCSTDDLFCGMGTDSSGQWLKVLNSSGEIGYLPNNYLQYCTWSNQDRVLKYIDESMEVIHDQAAQRAKYTSLQHEQLRVLLEHRKRVATNYELLIAALTLPSMHSHSLSYNGAANHTTDTSASYTTSDHSHKRQQVSAPPPIPARSCDTNAATTQELSSHGNETLDKAEQLSSNADLNILTSCGDVEFQNNETETISPEEMAANLTELLRVKTGLSYDKSKLGLSSVLGVLLEHNITKGYLSKVKLAIGKAEVNEETSQDVNEMLEIFASIADCKDDSQQRSWHLHDDEGFIHEKLSKLLSILTMGNQDLLASVIEKDLEMLHNLVLYYQMELRSSLRLAMLEVFAAIGSMRSKFIDTLLYTVLPLELVRDVLSTTDEQRLTFSCVVLSILFSTGEQLPVNYEELLDATFVEFLLDHIETEENDSTVDVMLSVLLSFNQHFIEPEQNLVMKCLAERTEATTLTEKFLTTLNREEDPVMVIPDPDRMSSVLKFAVDLYSLLSTASLLYTNDARVLIDIIVRQLTDLSAADKARTHYLKLMKLIVVNSDYAEHEHRQADLIMSLQQILSSQNVDTDTCTRSSQDKILAQSILGLIN